MLMSYQWPDQNGRPVDLTSLSHDQLLADTQKLVDAHRNLLDQALLKLAQDANYGSLTPPDTHSLNTKMQFTGRTKAMIEECQKRGLPIDVSR
jgi:hypothetical protein